MFEDEFFIRRKVNLERLQAYGFTQSEHGYQYATTVMDGQFQLYVFVSVDGVVSTKMIDNSTGEEYTLYKVSSSVGSYVGEVRAACANVLTDIAEKCFESDVFSGTQTRKIIQHVRETYADELEFLWEKFIGNAVWRRKDTKKWYGLLVTIPKSKLGIDSDEIVEAIVLRLKPEQMADTIDCEKYFPGWHMNKKSWYTIMLNGTVATEEICRRIDESYRLAVK